jgi:ferredoxin
METRIDQSKCKQCGLCMEVCPGNILAMNENGEVHFIPERLVICQHCGQCMAICATGAVRVEGLSYDSELVELPAFDVNTRAFNDFLANRRSVRHFKKQHVPDKVINLVLDSLSYVPFGCAPAKLHITVVNNRATIESALPHVEQFLNNIVKWIDHPIASRMIRRRNSAETFNTVRNHLYPISALGNYRLENGDRITRNAPALVIFHAPLDAEEHTRNAMIQATYAMLAVHAAGLGATMNGLVPAALNKVREVREIFQIPEGHEAVISLIMGYPKYRYRRAIRREPRNIHWVN